METYTKTGSPWILLWNTTKASKSEAYRLEMKLKNLSRKRLLEFMSKYDLGIVSPDELLLLKQLSGC